MIGLLFWRLWRGIEGWFDFWTEVGSGVCNGVCSLWGMAGPEVRCFRKVGVCDYLDEVWKEVAGWSEGNCEVSWCWVAGGESGDHEVIWVVEWP